jgi:hypothetical protein
VNPASLIDVQLLYRPTAGDTNAPAVNTSKYEIPNFIRSATGISKTFLLAHGNVPSGASPPPHYISGGGVCSTNINNPTKRPMTERSDPDNLVTTLGSGKGQASNFPNPRFRILVPGTYKCTGMGLGFSVDEFQIMLKRYPAGGGPTEVVATANGYAAPWAQVSASFQGTFSVANTNDIFTVEQYCQSQYNGLPPLGDPLSSRYSLGLPEDYTIELTFASLSCTLLN